MNHHEPLMFKDLPCAAFKTTALGLKHGGVDNFLKRLQSAVYKMKTIHNLIAPFTAHLAVFFYHA